MLRSNSFQTSKMWLSSTRMDTASPMRWGMIAACVSARRKAVYMLPPALWAAGFSGRGCNQLSSAIKLTSKNLVVCYASMKCNKPPVPSYDNNTTTDRILFYKPVNDEGVSLTSSLSENSFYTQIRNSWKRPFKIPHPSYISPLINSSIFQGISEEEGG